MRRFIRRESRHVSSPRHSSGAVSKLWNVHENRTEVSWNFNTLVIFDCIVQQNLTTERHKDEHITTWMTCMEHYLQWHVWSSALPRWRAQHLTVTCLRGLKVLYLTILLEDEAVGMFFFLFSCPEDGYVESILWLLWPPNCHLYPEVRPLLFFMAIPHVANYWLSFVACLFFVACLRCPSDRSIGLKYYALPQPSFGAISCVVDSSSCSIDMEVEMTWFGWNAQLVVMKEFIAHDT